MKTATLATVIALVAWATATATAGRAQDCIGPALRAKVISFRATDGVSLHGVLLGSGPNGIVLGGDAVRGNFCNWLPLARTLAQRGYRVLAYDLRPLPPRRSGPSGAHFARDVVGAEHELVRRGVRRVLVGGGGLGGTAAMTAAAVIPHSLLAGVVVLSSPRKFGPMDAEAAARRVAAPSFFGAGSLDSPAVDDVRKLYAASAAKRKQLVVVRSSGAGTDLLLPTWAPPLFRAKLLAFVAAAFGG